MAAGRTRGKMDGVVAADTALRLARYFSTSAELWLNLQKSYDSKLETKAKEHEIEKIEPRAA